MADTTKRITQPPVGAWIDRNGNVNAIPWAWLLRLVQIINMIAVGMGLVDSVSGTLPIVVDNTDPANPIVSVNVAAVGTNGVVNPDGSTITIDPDGTIHASGSSVTQVFNEIVTFVGTAGTLANVPTAGTQALYRNGQRQIPGIGNDYTIAGANITLALAAGAGDQFLADYEY